MTQSCDLENAKTALVVVCPVHSLEDLYNEVLDETKRRRPGKAPNLGEVYKQVRNKALGISKGKTLGRYMIGPCRLKKWENDVRIVDFQQAFSIPFPVLDETAERKKKWVTIKPPFREHLTQAFGRFFMRVALDSIIEKETVEHGLIRFKPPTPLTKNSHFP